MIIVLCFGRNTVFLVNKIFLLGECKVVDMKSNNFISELLGLIVREDIFSFIL